MAFTKRAPGSGIVVTIQQDQLRFNVRRVIALDPTTAPPPSVDFGLNTPASEMSGFRYELLDGAGKVIYRAIGRDPYAGEVEFPVGKSFAVEQRNDAEMRRRLAEPVELLLPETLARSARRLRMFSPGAAAALKIDPGDPVLEAPIDIVGLRLSIGGANFHG